MRLDAGDPAHEFAHGRHARRAAHQHHLTHPPRRRRKPACSCWRLLMRVGRVGTAIWPAANRITWSASGASTVC